MTPTMIDVQALRFNQMSIVVLVLTGFIYDVRVLPAIVALILLAGAIQPGTYTFYVEFQTDDGELWTMGPCCGSETDPTVSQFPFVVSWTAEGPRVLTTPVYTP